MHFTDQYMQSEAESGIELSKIKPAKRDFGNEQVQMFAHVCRQRM